ncbi:hypothetical protein ABHN05_13090 [Brevibacillus laterosporus]|uniref:hypothetical protein n=1 Tax=Brevibacillus laterosporus TaxID=1465 RepID=UPI00112622BF|nr:hypothetical protein [Brevibacillus laterosporus]MBG9790989.1 hypothetical protein [Brevibacillus laterosporus]MBG9804888.1 hypothetical protein [Brevibacillus laterosporus]MED1790534.1 hypothetical protein [Brevibacillus laterosporus]MED4762105.1 hypothetical protein [Brevibacillus laterosporus]TPH09966.1 hypothetical protein EGH09_21665 [Brevibacillus laterosporus]
MEKSKVNWSQVRYFPKLNPRVIQERHKKAMECLAKIGVIRGDQLRNMFFRGKKSKVKQMEYYGMIVKHELLIGDRSIFFYTLSPALIEEYNGLYIRDYKRTVVSAIIEKLVFLDTVMKFDGFKPILEETNESPFVGVIKIGKNKIYTGVIYKNIQEWQHYFKWSPNDQKRNVLLVVENLDHLKPLEIPISSFLNQNSRLRVLIRREKERSFYIWDGFNWVRE